MYKTVSKREKRSAGVMLGIFILCMVGFLPDTVSIIGSSENPVQIIASAVITIAMVYFFCTSTAAVVYARTLCSVDDGGITANYRLPLKKDRHFAWSNIDKVVLAALGDKTELEFRLYTKDFASHGHGFARRLPPNSAVWGNKSYVIKQQKRMVTMQYTPDLYELIKRYHPDIICIPNEQVIEGYRELLSEDERK